MSYIDRLKAHLHAYKVNALGVAAHGQWRNASYNHILPSGSEKKNILPGIEEEFWAYADALPASRLQGLTGDRKPPKLHAGFAHLNSSQALAFNLFFPFMRDGFAQGALLLRALKLPTDEPITELWFEEEPDGEERTNFDVVIRVGSGKHYVVEVKLSEQEFGTCKKDPKHEKKLKDVYRADLASKVSPDFLEFPLFGKHYQLLRHVFYLGKHNIDRIVLLFPESNECLEETGAILDKMVNAEFRPRVSIVHLEQLIASLLDDPASDPFLNSHFTDVARKYLPAA